MGLLINVLAIAAGMLARNTTDAATEAGICAIGVIMLKKIPIATPSDTPRRDHCHSLASPNQGASQRVQRLDSKSLRLGTKERIRSNKVIYTRSATKKTAQMVILPLVLPAGAKNTMLS